MKVDPLGQPRTAPARRRPSGSSGGAFARSLQEAGGAASAGAGPLGSVDALLALQEVGSATTGSYRGQQQKRHGEDLLDRLEELRLALLEGRVPERLLQRLADGLAQRPSAGSNPDLEAVLDDIELRAAVELAKLERARAAAG